MDCNSQSTFDVRPNSHRRKELPMFNIEELRKNNRTSLFISSFAAQIAPVAMLLLMVLGSPSALGTPSPRPTPAPTAAPRPNPQAPGNFRVTALGTCTVSVEWD